MYMKVITSGLATNGRSRKTIAMALLTAAVLCCLPISAQSAVVTQLDITGGSIDLNFGSMGHLSGPFTKNGHLLMNQFQSAPNIVDPVTIGHLTFSIFTSSGGTLNLAAPTAQTSGATMTADLRSLFASVTGTGWSGLLASPPTPLTTSLNIGGIATGSFNGSTKAFDISWTHAFTGIPSLTSGTISLQGTAQLAAVPLPAAAWLFGSGVIGLIGLARRKLRATA
jgi:hypothetical protein